MTTRKKQVGAEPKEWTSRLDIRLKQDDPIDVELLNILQAIARRNRKSVTAVAEEILKVFAPAAAMSIDFDLAKRQQDAIARMTGHQPSQHTFQHQPVFSGANNNIQDDDFTSIPAL